MKLCDVKLLTQKQIYVSKPKLQITCEAKQNKAVVKIEGYISGWDDLSTRIKNAVEDLVSKGIKDLEVYINSPGGSVFEANEIGNTLAKFNGTKTAVLGALCASAATYIASICNKVIASANTSYMIHKPWMVADGNADEIEARLKNLKNLQALYAMTYSAKTGLTIDEINDLWKEDYWMNADEALEKKFVDEVDDSTAALSTDDIQAISEMGYKHIPKLAATVTLHKPNADIMKKLLVPILAAFAAGLTEESNDAQFLAGIEAMKAKALKADELQAQFDNLQKETKNKEIEAVLSAAQENKQILASEVEYYREQLNASFDKTKAHIEAKPKVAKLSEHAGNSGAQGANVDRSKWTYADYQEKDVKALQALAESDPVKYEELAKAHYKTL